MPAIPAQLVEVKNRLSNGLAVDPITTRLLLGWFKAERRNPLTNAYIKAAIDELCLKIEPDFEGINIDAPLVFGRRDATVVESPTKKTRESSAHFKKPEAPVVQPKPIRNQEDPTLRVRVLSSAIRYPVVVNPDSSLARATTLMLSKDYSQLPVVSNQKLRGAISWRSIARQLVLGVTVTKVSECIEHAVEIRSDTPLLQAIELITESDYALIVDVTRRLVGLVTTADLSREFRSLSEPFLLLREAENYIRNLLDAALTIEELKPFRDPAIKREIHSIADLSLGEYLRALANDLTWARLNLPVDRGLFVESLDKVRAIRNDVMHFDPDPIEPSRLSTLNDFVRLLQAVGEKSTRTSK